MGRTIFGMRIQSAIGFRGKTQKEIAKRIGITENAMSKIIRGETRSPSADIIRKTAEILHVSGDYLLGLSDDPLNDGKMRGSFKMSEGN